MSRGNAYKIAILFSCATAGLMAAIWHERVREAQDWRAAVLEAYAAAVAPSSSWREISLDVPRAISDQPGHWSPGAVLATGSFRASSLGRRLDAAPDQPARITAFRREIAARLIDTAENETDRAAFTIASPRGGIGHSVPSSATTQIEHVVSRIRSAWSKADHACRQTELAGSGLRCPVAGDSRFALLAAQIEQHGERGLRLVADNVSVRLVYPTVYTAAVCNSAPYAIEAMIVRTPGVRRDQAIVQPGTCVQFDDRGERPNLYVVARPVRDDRIFQIVSHAQDTWRTVRAWTAESDDRYPLCAQVLDTHVTGGVQQCLDQILAGSMQYATTGEKLEGRYPIERAIFEVLDPHIAARTPAATMGDAATRSRHARDLNGALRNRLYWIDHPNHFPWITLGLELCEDDPLAPGVRVCGIAEQRPDGLDPIAYPGEIILELNDIPVYGLQDLWAILHSYDNAMTLDIPLRVRVETGWREGLAYFNPRAFSGCPFEAGDAFWSAFWRSFGSDFFGCASEPAASRPACRGARYEAALRRTQFCTAENMAGEMAGALVGVFRSITRALVVGLLRDARRRVALQALRSSIGVGAMQALDEFAYAFATAPPLSSARDTLARAAPSMALGFTFGVLTSR